MLCTAVRTSLLTLFNQLLKGIWQIIIEGVEKEDSKDDWVNQHS